MSIQLKLSIPILLVTAIHHILNRDILYIYLYTTSCLYFFLFLLLLYSFSFNCKRFRGFLKNKTSVTLLKTTRTFFNIL